MPFVNRLKNKCGGKDAFYIAKSTSPLVWSDEFSYPDSLISQKQKDKGVRLLYYPMVYTIKRDEKDGSLVLKDISNQNQPLPKTLAGFKDVGFPQITVYGYMLAIDDCLKESLSAQEQKKIEAFVKHFEKIKAQNPALSVAHELTHLDNRTAFLEAHKKFENLKLSPEDFLKLRFADEIFASAKEQLVAQNPTTQEDMEKIVRDIQQNWLKDENKKHYYQDESSDFASQLDQYNNITKNRKVDSKHLMFQELLDAYTSFERDGKTYHLSSVINLDFNMPEKLKKYAGISSPLPFSKASLER